MALDHPAFCLSSFSDWYMLQFFLFWENPLVLERTFFERIKLNVYLYKWKSLLKKLTMWTHNPYFRDNVILKENSF